MYLVRCRTEGGIVVDRACGEPAEAQRLFKAVSKSERHNVTLFLNGNPITEDDLAEAAKEGEHDDWDPPYV